MLKQIKRHDDAACMPRAQGTLLRLVRRLRAVVRQAEVLAVAALLCAAAGCSAKTEIAPLTYECATNSELSPSPGDGTVCGAGDDTIGAEPTLPTDVCQTLVANRSASDMSPPDEANQDTVRVQAALDACKGKGAVKLVSDGANNAFITSFIKVDSVILWVDTDTTLYASRNAELYQHTGSCGVIGINDSSACNDFIEVTGASPGIVGDGTIDGQGGEPLVGHDYSWWQLSYALREVDGSIGNPTLVDVIAGTTNFLMYRITLHNAPKFHVKLSSSPVGGVCDSPGKGFRVWGVTLLTPSKWTNSQGLVLSPSFARNTDGIDPGSNSVATCGVLACNTISTGDDHMAIKGGHFVSNLVIAHNHFGTGHGMSIGSETYGDANSGTGVDTIDIHDLTIDADSRPVGSDAQVGDFNGIRIKSDESRGGIVNNVTFNRICMRDMNNTILISTAYNPLFAGTSYPEFKSLTFNDVHHVSCFGLTQPVVTLNGFNAVRPAGPITLNNVVVDNIGPEAIAAQFSNIVLGPGAVNFAQYIPLSQGVTVTNNVAGNSTPYHCVFPKLPAPRPPPGWLN
jgi:polygalacturonase